MKIEKTLFIYFLCLLPNLSFSQCLAPTGTNSSNVNYYNAYTNWTSANSVHHYKIRYKIIGTNNWSYKNNIDSSATSKLLNNLTPLSDYIWQIKSYCDTINVNMSSWSTTDTFTTETNACPNTNMLYTSNINYNNATASWDAVNGAHRYKLRYRQIGSNSWSNLGPIYHPNNNAIIPLLQQNTYYEWQIMTYHDSTILLGSLWSASDTFVTTSFSAAPFNPNITSTLSTLECNNTAELSLIITQTINEPDIASSIIATDGGHFNIIALNSGDSIGYATMTTNNQIINSTLKVGLTIGSNLAIINSYDSTESIIGIFTIENTNDGVKISSTSPNDGNNYTSGYSSEIHITNLFTNPNLAGPLHFYTEIESELNDQYFKHDTLQVWCNSTSINDIQKDRTIIEIYDVLGKKTNDKKNKIVFIKFSDGSIEKRITQLK